MKSTLLVTVFILLQLSSFAQNFTISGTLLDSSNEEVLIGAHIYDTESRQGTISNEFGFYSITLPKGKHNIRYSYVGYAPVEVVLDLIKDQEIDTRLTAVNYLSEVKVVATRAEKIEQSTQMSAISVPLKQLLQLPAFLGEADVLKTIQLLPGVNPGVEGSSGLYVRGGSPDQNLILLDGTPLYNVSHLFGFFSLFNADAISNVDLIKGGFPARYGGRLSSVLEINMRDGDKTRTRVKATLGLSAKALIEGPIKKGKSSYIITARRTYLDALINPLLTGTRSQGPGQKQGYYFLDLNAKLNFQLSPKDKLYISGYYGKDKFYNEQKPYEYLFDGVVYSTERKDNLQWGNKLLSARWTHQFSNKLFASFTLNNTDYKYEVVNYLKDITTSSMGVEESKFSQVFYSGINDYSAKAAFSYIPNTKHYIRFGAQTIYHRYRPGATAFENVNTEDPVGNLDTLFGANEIQAWESNIYIEDDHAISDKLKINYGLHFSHFGVGDNNYFSAQPRVAARYLIGKNISLKASYALMQQNVHLLTNSSIGLPTDLWVPTSDKIKPEWSHQVAVGLGTTIKNAFECSLEGYYKHMDGVLDYVNGSNTLNANISWQDRVEQGVGEAYGVEAFLQKKYGVFQGWVSYGLSWTNRTFPTINFGETFPFKYDNRHQASIAVTYDFDNKKYRAGAVWVFSSGNAMTIANIKHKGSPTGVINTYETRNNFRAAAYHRLDLSIQRVWRYKNDKELTVNFGVYNMYGRRNPFYYYIGQDFYGNASLTRVSLFVWVPSVSVTYKL